MNLITLEQAREHVKAEGDDDELITQYANAAEAMCAKLANRSLFATTADKTAVVATVGARMSAAYTAYDTAIANADAQDDDRVAKMLKGAAKAALNDALTLCENDANGLALDAAPDAGGMPANDAVIAAILLLLGAYYSVRTTTIAGQSAAAVEIPQGTADIMACYRWIGPDYA